MDDREYNRLASVARRLGYCAVDGGFWTRRDRRTGEESTIRSAKLRERLRAELVALLAICEGAEGEG